MNFYINEASTNSIVISSLSSKLSLIDPHFIFRFTDVYSDVSTVCVEDLSEYATRYSKFLITDGSGISFKDSGSFEIFESPNIQLNIDGSCNLVYSDRYIFIKDLSINETYYAFDPSDYSFDFSDTYVAFDPSYYL